MRLTQREIAQLAQTALVDVRTFERYLKKPASKYSTAPRERIEQQLRAIGRGDLVRS